MTADTILVFQLGIIQLTVKVSHRQRYDFGETLIPQNLYRLSLERTNSNQQLKVSLLYKLHFLNLIRLQCIL